MRVGAGVRETKILRTPSRRAQRALVRVAPAARKLDLREQRRGPRAAARRGQRRGGGGEGEGAMNDRNQRNTAPRKLPGIRPAYIIRTGVPAGAASTQVERSERTERPEEEKRARGGSRRGAADFYPSLLSPGPPRITARPDRVLANRLNSLRGSPDYLLIAAVRAA